MNSHLSGLGRELWLALLAAVVVELVKIVLMLALGLPLL
jgi:hypothetical protein